jgi:predicted SAM-dependent methyltransferase
MKLSLLVDKLEKLSSKVLFTPLKQIINFRTKSRIENLIKNTDCKKIEIGAGPKKGVNGWLTMDLVGADIEWDLRYGMPFSDNSIDQIYSSHLFEHLTTCETSKLLEECKRVLNPGGIFSICVPNAKRYIEAYLNKDASFWEQQQEDFYVPAYNDTTIIDYINYVAYMDGQHKYMFDQENLLHILKSHNFKSVRLRDFDPALDIMERDFESIYAEAVK